MYVTCPRCGGRGKVIPNPCASCRGEGRVQKRASVKFKIPAGIDRGQRLRLEGEGEAGRGGGPQGDLYILFDVEQDPLYERDGYDLHRKLPVSWPLLVLGGTMSLETLYGKDVIKIPSGTDSNSVIKVPNAGIPRLRASGRGDLYLHVSVDVPKKLSSEQEELVKSLMGSMAQDSEGDDEGFFAKVFGGDKTSKKKKRK